MKAGLVKLLSCPECKSDLEIVSSDSFSEIRTGSLVCRCGKEYPIRAGVPRFVSDDSYVPNFSFEWKIHKKTQLDNESANISESDFSRKTGFCPEDVHGKTILDVGCGMGRFMDVIQKWGGHVIGVDLSFAVDSAYANLGTKPNVEIIQANVFDLPLKEEVFDIIYSIGVLHHTPETSSAFMCLPRHLKKDGYIAIWVYSNYNRLHSFSSNILRKATIKLPQRVLYALCFLAVPLYFLYKIPVLGYLFRNLLPISMQPKWNWRVLDTFDWYSPKYQWKHRYPEVFNWFREAGLRDIETFEPPIGIKGRKQK